MRRLRCKCGVGETAYQNHPFPLLETTSPYPLPTPPPIPTLSTLNLPTFPTLSTLNLPTFLHSPRFNPPSIRTNTLSPFHGDGNPSLPRSSPHPLSPPPSRPHWYLTLAVMIPKLITLFFFLLSLSQSSALLHPLDPLTPSEISTIRRVIKNSHLGSSKSLTFQYVGLDEPDKPEVYSWLSGHAAPPRRAFVIVRSGRRTHEIYVDITNHSITSDKVYNGFGYPMLNSEEQGAAAALPLNYTPFIESVKKRGEELKDVVCSTFSVGWFGEVKQGKRLLKILCFMAGDTVNFYARPLEGITVVVDLDAMEIVEYEDRFVVPVPKSAGTDYRASKQKPPLGTKTKPGAVIQPEGKGFELDGHVIRFRY